MSAFTIFLLAAAAASLLMTSIGMCSHIPAHVLKLERAACHHNLSIEEIKARDIARHARLFEGLVSYQLGGSALDPSGLYYTTLKLGTPSQQFKVLVDTGSDLTWVNCKGCTTCPVVTSSLNETRNFFNAPSSSTASVLQCSDQWCPGCRASSEPCHYRYGYISGSRVLGVYVMDQLSFDTRWTNFANSSSAAFVFGCSTARVGGLATEDRFDGIMGFGPGILSIVQQLSFDGKTHRVFSHCLQGLRGGQLAFGAMEEPSILYTPSLKSQPNYYVTLESIAVNGIPLPVNSEIFKRSARHHRGGTVVDSGTTFAYVVSEAYEHLTTAVSTAALRSGALVTGDQQDSCYIILRDMNDIFPRLSFNLADGVTLHLEPGDYLWLKTREDGSTEWCFGIQRGNNTTILGDLVLKDRIVVYDLEHNQIGISMDKCDCSLPRNVRVSSGHQASDISRVVLLLMTAITIFLWF